LPGVALSAPLRIIPYKSGLVDLEFACDRRAAEQFFRNIAGEGVDFVVGGTVVASARAPDSPSTSRCALLGGGLGEAIGTCEAFATAAGKDKGACRTPCGQDETWACIVHD
jgi:hypothetical protein